MQNATDMQPNEVGEEKTGDDVDSTGSASADNPRSNKPLMEKRRRARINKSLNELKTMLVQALKGNSCGHSKLEKADILEMTVRYMRKLEQHRARTTRIDPNVLNKYKAGFNECRNEVMKFLSTHEGVSVEVRTRLLDHLANCQQSLQDQDQEDLLEDEFMLAGVSSSWRQSPVSTDDSLSRVSPSAPHPPAENDPTSERPGQNPGREDQSAPSGDCLTGKTYVGGQFQIIATEPSTPAIEHSCTDTTNAILQSTSERDGAACTTSRSYFHKTSQRRDHSNLVTPTPQYGRHIEPLVQLVESRLPRLNNPTAGEHLMFRMRNVAPDLRLSSLEFHGRTNSDESSTDASLSPELRSEVRSAVEYTQSETNYRHPLESSIQRRPQDLKELKNTKGPWRPWSHETS